MKFIQFSLTILWGWHLPFHSHWRNHENEIRKMTQRVRLEMVQILRFEKWIWLVLVIVYPMEFPQKLPSGTSRTSHKRFCICCLGKSSLSEELAYSIAWVCHAGEHMCRSSGYQSQASPTFQLPSHVAPSRQDDPPPMHLCMASVNTRRTEEAHS